MSMSSQTATTPGWVTAHYDNEVRALVAEHAARKDEPLVLAVRYNLDDPRNVHLLEVLDSFPGTDDDELFDNEFLPTHEFRILGTLRLAIGNPGQLRAAIDRGDDELVRAIGRDGGAHAEVLHQAPGSGKLRRIAKELRGLLGL